MLLNCAMGIGGGLFDYYYARDSPYLTVRAAVSNFDVPFSFHILCAA